MKIKELTKINKKFFIIVQARLGSSRFPEKILKKLDHRSILDFLIENLLKIINPQNIIIATTKQPRDKKLVYLKKKYGIKIFFGSEKNVLDRYIKAAKKFSATKIIRITSDCPLIDLEVLSNMVKKFDRSNYDYISNNCVLSGKRYPDGMDVEIFNFKSLIRSKKYCTLSSDYEHVTNVIWQSKKFKIGFFKPLKDLSHFRLSVDYAEDLKILRKMLKYIKSSKKKYCLNNYLSFFKINPKLEKYMINNLKKFYTNRPDLINR